MNNQCDILKENNDESEKPELYHLLDKVFELHHNIENF